jgi:hypothetical protein
MALGGRGGFDHLPSYLTSLMSMEVAVTVTGPRGLEVVRLLPQLPAPQIGRARTRRLTRFHDGRLRLRSFLQRG